VAVGAVLGFGDPAPVPLISLEQQIAQKIHAVTHPGSQRAHDLVDLQLLWRAGTEGEQGLDLPLLAQLCQRTFDYRRAHPWPPTGAALPNLLEPAYQAALEEADPGNLLPNEPDDGSVATPDVSPAVTLSDATGWLADRIAEIAANEPMPR
jgi:hypothetical protein